MPITITLQAASDSPMTEDSYGGNVIPEEDLRRVYGLPNQYVGSDGKIHFVEYPRWDIISDPSENAIIRTELYDGVLEVVPPIWQTEEFDDIEVISTGKHRPPTTCLLYTSPSPRD